MSEKVFQMIFKETSTVFHFESKTMKLESMEEKSRKQLKYINTLNKHKHV